jgi:hypothetical protein
MKVGDLVRTITGNLALVSKIDETITDRWGEEQISFVTLIYSDTSVQNCYSDARHLTLIQKGLNESR